MFNLILCFVATLAAEIDVNTVSNYLQIAQEEVHIEWLLDLDKQFINATSQNVFKVRANSLLRVRTFIYFRFI